MNIPSSFYNTIVALRQQERITLFTKMQDIAAWEDKEVIELLKSEFEKERLSWTLMDIPFNEQAAIWAAKTIYNAAQLLMLRGGTAKNLDNLFPSYKNGINNSSILSADLCLRFLPQIVMQLKITDAEDLLIPILENSLKTFHYSAIGFEVELGIEDWAQVLSDVHFKKLYLERIVIKQDYHLAEMPYINQQLNATFGLYKNKFWSNLKTINQEP